MVNERLCIIVAVHKQHAELERMLEWIESIDFISRKICFYFCDSGHNEKLLSINCQNKSNLDFVSQADSGIYDAWNYAINAVECKYVAFLGVTDRVDSCFEFSIKNDSDLVAYDFLRKYDSSLSRVTVPKQLFRKFPYSLKFCFSSAIFRREFLKANPFKADFKIIGDLAWAWENRELLKASVVNELFCVFDMGGVSNETKMHLNRLKEYKKVSPHFRWTPHYLAYSILSTFRMLIR